MFDFHEKRKIRTFMYSKISVGVLLLLTAIFSVSVFERFRVEREMVNKKNITVEELSILQQKAELLETEVNHLKNERGIEEELRGRFDLVKEGEQMVVIVGEDTQKDNISDGSEDEDSEEKSFIERLKFW